MTIQQRDPNDLSVHPSLKEIPELTEDELKPIRSGMKQCGLIQPLLVDDHNRILDDHSRTLWLCAKKWQHKTVPVQVRTDDVDVLIIHSLVHRRHLSKSALAYLAEPRLQNAIKTAVHNYRQNLAKGQQIPVGSQELTGAPTIAQLAESLGLSESTLDRAREVRGLFKAHSKSMDFVVEGGPEDGSVVSCTLQAWFEPKILKAYAGGEHEGSRPLGLGAVISAIQGILATKDNKRIETRGQMELFERHFIKGSGNHYKYWHSMSATSRREALEKLAARAETMKPEDCMGAAEFYREIAKVYAGACRTGQQAK